MPRLRRVYSDPGTRLSPLANRRARMTPLQHNSLLVQIRIPRSSTTLQGAKQCHPEPVTAIAGTESRDPVYEQSLDCFFVALHSVTRTFVSLSRKRESTTPFMDPQLKLGMTVVGAIPQAACRCSQEGWRAWSAANARSV